MAPDPTLELSVVIPVYRSETILPALAAKLGQTLPLSFGDSFEVILVNDCSPDRSWDVIVELHANALGSRL
ncbi:hypothetical protein G6F50_018591 [Rhizopus delemar]|uniref:Glycosyltransferase 2-like domain-containing protein n=1 Tax=Rhizopus delemar TaxID=936053 RepID=A0A9P7BYX7_9FUNG|nr:hypothetical protein G6F50_018591 [Rhizopus delemar]